MVKLHMIENRMKLEKQILLGKHTVKKELQSKAEKIRDQENLPDALRKVQPGLPTATSPQPTGSDVPLAIDSDTEPVVSHRHLPQKQEASESGGSTPRDIPAGNDQLGSSSTRRRWASEFLHFQDKPTHDYHDNNTAAPSSPTLRARLPLSKSPSGSFFSRLRTQSFNALSPFAHHRNLPHPNHREGSVDHTWSSDSSSDDGLSVTDRRFSRNPSILHLRQEPEVMEVDDDDRSDSDV